MVFDDSVDYVFVSEECNAKNIDLEIYRINEKTVNIVKSKWIEECFDKSKLFPIENYVIQ